MLFDPPEEIARPKLYQALPPPSRRSRSTFGRCYAGSAYRNAMRREDPVGFQLLTDGGFCDEHWDAFAAAFASFESRRTEPLSWFAYIPPGDIDAIPDAGEREWHHRAMVLCCNGPYQRQPYLNWVRPSRATDPERLCAHGLIRFLVDAERLVAHLSTLDDLDGAGRRSLEEDREHMVRTGWPFPTVLDDLLEYYHLSAPAARLARALPRACLSPFEMLAPAQSQLAEWSVERVYQIYDHLGQFAPAFADNVAREKASVERWWQSWTRHLYGHDLAILIDTFDTPLFLKSVLEAVSAARAAFDPGKPSNIRVLDALGAIDGRDKPNAAARDWHHERKIDLPTLYALLTEYETVLTAAQSRITRATQTALHGRSR
jgi:hypothetical protein